MSVPPEQDDALLGPEPPRSPANPDPPELPSKSVIDGRYRPRERFWPYVELPEQLTDEEIAALDPDLHAELFVTPRRQLSITVVLPELDAPDYAREVEQAKAAAEFRETGTGSSFRHRARFWPA